MDEFVGLYGAYYSWGEQQLMAAVDSTGVGYGGIYASEMGRHDFGVDTYDSLHVTPDTAEINASQCISLSESERPGWCDVEASTPFADTIVYGDSTWVLQVLSTHDSISSVTWWVDTIVTWVNASAGTWLTATNSGDTTVKIVEDSSYLDISFRFTFADVTQWAVSSGPPSRIWSYWSSQNPTSFTMFNDNVYITNGDQRGVVWNGEMAHSYPLAAFGEPLVTPIARQSGEDADYVIDGEVRYAVAMRMDTTNGTAAYSDTLFGAITAPVKTKNGRFMLHSFALQADDSVVNFGANDSLWYVIYRTTSNPGRLTETTDMYKTGIFVVVLGSDTSAFVFDSTTLDTTTFSSLADVVVIDSLPDSVLTNRNKTRKAISTVWAGRDSLGVLGRRTGAPTYISGAADTLNDSTRNSKWDQDSSWGLFAGIPPQNDTLGWAYAVAPMDTLNGNEGPLSEWCVIYNDNGATSKTFKRLTVGLPPLPPGDSGIVYNLYRSLIYQVGEFAPGYDTKVDYDSALHVWFTTVYAPSNIPIKRPENLVPKSAAFHFWLNRQAGVYRSGGWFDYRRWVDPGVAVDTTILLFPYFVAQIPAADSIYSDSMRYDSLELRRIYSQTEPPARVNQLAAHDGYMFGTDGSLLYRSQLDSATKWGAWDFTPVNNDDGDRITTFWPTRTAIRVKKNFTSWNAFDNYDRTEINEGWGCIAPFSHVKGVGHYFLSTRGIEIENEGQYLERTFTGNLLSQQLKSFEDRTIADLSDMIGFYLPTDQIALFSLDDTTWAYFEKTQSWATWSMPFRGATLYDTEDELNFIPGKTMYFYKDNDPNLYRYGTSSTDNGSAIPVTWRSGVYSADRYMDQVLTVGMWMESGLGYDSTITVRVYQEDGTANDSIVFPSLASGAFQWAAYGGKTPMQYFQIELYNSGTVSNTEVNMIDFTVNRKAGHVKGE
jgi:hypothetical protein